MVTYRKTGLARMLPRAPTQMGICRGTSAFAPPACALLSAIKAISGAFAAAATVRIAAGPARLASTTKGACAELTGGRRGVAAWLASLHTGRCARDWRGDDCDEAGRRIDMGACGHGSSFRTDKDDEGSAQMCMSRIEPEELTPFTWHGMPCW